MIINISLPDGSSEQFESDFAIISAGNQTFIGGIANFDNIINSVIRIILSSHNVIKNLDLENIDEYTLHRYLEDIEDGAYYIKEKVIEDKSLLNSSNHTTSISMSDDVIQQIILDFLSKYDNDNDEDNTK